MTRSANLIWSQRWDSNPGIVTPILSRAESCGSMTLGTFLGMAVGIVVWFVLAGVLTDVSAMLPFRLGP